jgi:ribonuclease D
VTYRWIDSQADFEALIDRLCAEPRYALDTEFHRERTYFPKLALMQFATDTETCLVDPLAVDLAPLRRLFDSDALAVLHAAQQDLDVLTHACGAVPSKMYDTQLASGFLGYSTPSLVSLLMAELKVSAAKGDRLTDWLRRPLSPDQMTLRGGRRRSPAGIAGSSRQATGRTRRSEWVAEACEELRRRPASGTDPSQAWLRIKDVRMLKPRARGVARAVCEWRERRAMSVDVPVRQILPDLAVLGIAQRQPKTTTDLIQARGWRSGTARATSAGRSSTPWPTGSAATSTYRFPTVTSSTAICGRRSRWSPHGWPTWRANNGSTPRCWRPGPTSSRCCVATATPASCTAGAPSWSATASSGWCRAGAGLTFDGRADCA